MRIFVGVLLSDENQQLLRAPVQALVRVHSDVLRAIPDGTAHITMSFIGQVDASVVKDVHQAMDETVRARGPIAIELSVPRILRARQDPRLILLPVSTGASQVDALAGDLHRALTTRFPNLELSPAKGAHVTIVRFRKHARLADARAVEQSLTSSALASLVLQDTVRDIRLFESELTPAGPNYRERHRSPFGNSR